MKARTFTAIIPKEEYVAACLEVGIVDQGAPLEEALANLQEVTRLYLEECL